MIDGFVDFLLGIPETVASFSDWLIEPIDSTFLNISPLALFSVAGVAIIIGIIAVHVVRLFI